MIKDEIIAIAKEAQQDHEVQWSEADLQTVAFSLRFAALVAAAERKACAEQYAELIAKSIGEAEAREREAILKIAEKIDEDYGAADNAGPGIISAIRARG